MERRHFLRSASGALVTGAAAPGLLPGRARAAAPPAADGASPPRALRELARRLTGRLLLPRSPGFAAENLPANDVYEHITPLAIALCATSADVVTCVNWCRREGVQPVVRGGGHNYNGASCTTGLLIKTGNLNKVVFSERHRTVTLQSGALNRDLLATLRGGRLMLPIGTCPTVGVAGLALGGGIGDNSRWAGMTSDHLVSTRVVLASGEHVTASAREHPDLFWACRGGAGGNFGINTELTFSLFELPRPTVTVYGMLFHGAEQAAAALAAYDKLMLTAPVELSGFAGLTNQRPFGYNPHNRRTRKLFPELSIDGSYLGPPEQARELLAPLVAEVKPDDWILGEFEFWTAQINWLAVPGQPKHGFAEAARFTNAALPDQVIAELVQRVTTAPGGTGDAYAEVRLMCWSGGHVINGVAPGATAYVHRESTSLLRPAVWWRNTHPALQRDLLDWMASTWSYIQPHTQDQAFQNWPYAGITDWPTAYYGANFERLVRVKQAYDPRNLFHYAQSIPVSSGRLGHLRSL